WRGPNKEAGGKSGYNNVQVGGAPTKKLAESQVTIMCKLGWDDEINFAKISFLSHSHWHLRSLNVQLEYMYNNIKHAVKRSQSIQTDFAHRVFLT
ncbi:hypothetical protein, partial [Staphylococcus aureus]|uniref:hypothetical protein n=2 Tax=Staphylococcus aureus TaxID=1280 RepID=UPI001CC0EBD7